VSLQISSVAITHYLFYIYIFSSCLKPIIFLIPSGNWYCPLCCHKKLISNLGEQLEKLDTLVHNIEAEELRLKKQQEIRKLAEITAENILADKRKNRQDRRSEARHISKQSSSDDENESSDESSSNSSDNAPLYKLRKRNQTTASYRFNDYDDLINSAIRKDMDEVKGLGNAGRGKDISTIIEADKEEKKQQKLDKEKTGDDKSSKHEEEENEGESSDSDIVRTKASIQRKKKARKLNNLDETSEEDKASDEDFKGKKYLILLVLLKKTFIQNFSRGTIVERF
jgi:remodeling and spacing factor 1